DGQAAFGPELDAHSMLMVWELAKLEIVEVGSTAEVLVPPASLAEFTLDSPLDFYDVSLVDSYNMPISILPYDDAGLCQSVACRKLEPRLPL
ncbi:thaumatin-like protein, partial [Tanacetum coccineum]